ncbi:hypothetical protein DMA12_21365 [Amycolatopsis balhimycina DSM 5908]|uniref:Uncharacterized protein n=2 Tax=Amycolatopsis balhimycina TaxID=208443 RepID=A0A428WHA3_AMYBA|nr:hypothetical protein DMA12_21365 [Amycolatopsis balhimycina DSM 5908]
MPLMDPVDRALISRVQELARGVDRTAPLKLSRERNPDQFAENLRDLGLEFVDLGVCLLARVDELDRRRS